MTFSGNENESDEEEEEEDEIKANGMAGGDSIGMILVEICYLFFKLKLFLVQQLIGPNKRKSSKPSITMMVDLAFASNVRFLDDHELYLDNVELYRVSQNTAYYIERVSKYIPHVFLMLCILFYYIRREHLPLAFVFLVCFFSLFPMFVAT